MESQCPALLLQPPAHIDIVAGNVELRIKSPYGFEGGREPPVSMRDI